MGEETVLTIAADPYWMEALRCRQALRAYLIKRTRNAATADDLLQDTYARFTAVEKSNIRSVNSWLFTTAHHLVVDWARRQSANPVMALDEAAIPDPVDERTHPERDAMGKEQLTILINRVNQLPPQRRRVFVLRKVYGFTTSEIAAHLGIKESTVVDHLKHALRTLATLMRQ